MKTLLRRLICFSYLMLPQPLLAISVETRENLEQLEDRLEEHIEDGFVYTGDLLPLVVVDISSDREDKQVLTTAVLQTLNRTLKSKIMVCDRCQSNYEQSGERTIYESGFVDADKVRDIYAKQPTKPRAALWARQSGSTLSLRIISLQNSTVLYADTIDKAIDWPSRSLRSFSLSRRAERQARGDVILHGHIDFGIALAGSGAHIGYSWMQQWGEGNQYLSGISFNLSDPILGLGINTFRVMPSLNNALLGGKILVSLPEAIGSSVSDDNNREQEQQTYSLVLMIKYPLFGEPEKFYGNAFISTSGLMGVGMSW